MTTKNHLLKHKLIPIIYIYLFSISLLFNSGCMPMMNYAISGGISEMAALVAVGVQMQKYPYIDFNQIFPETYSFELSKHQTWKKILNVLDKNNENIINKNLNEGFIFTEAKKAPTDNSDNQHNFENYYYQYSIFITSIDNNMTYVTCYPTMLEGENKEVLLPMARNWFRGIFFGTLAAEIYPAKKRQSIIIAKKAGKIINEDQREINGAETIHTMQQGETLGKVAKKYTGNVMNYKTIAIYNNIDNINKIRVGQQLKIPPDIIQ